MRTLCSLHNHTVLCDGADTPRDIALYAIECGCDTLGFSSHAPYGAHDTHGGCLDEELTAKYHKEIIALKEEFKGRIEIALGIERDRYSPIYYDGYDYVIGSVHYVEQNGEYICVDNAYDIFKSGVERCFGGDYIAFARRYYELVAEMPEYTKCDIVGHFDLLVKFNENVKYIDETDRTYRNIALEALDALLDKDLIIEVNTGAMSRGYRTSPYPNDFFIKRVVERNGRMMISSDSHKKENLFAFYNDAEERLKQIGVKELWVYKNGRFVPEII